MIRARAERAKNGGTLGVDFRKRTGLEKAAGNSKNIGGFHWRRYKALACNYGGEFNEILWGNAIYASIAQAAVNQFARLHIPGGSTVRCMHQDIGIEQARQLILVNLIAC